MKYTFLILVGAVVMVGCATKEGRSTPSTSRIANNNTKAQQDVQSALDSKDRIYQLQKQNQQYDAKEIKLLNN